MWTRRLGIHRSHIRGYVSLAVGDVVVAEDRAI